jgi:SAM-dependent methyltransferase
LQDVLDHVFTAHNIRLNDGTQTFPAQPSMENIPIFQAAKRALNLIFHGDLKGKSIADLGCLEGGYATEFARLGMDATGIEVRDSNFQNCLYVKAKTELPNLNFIQDDAMNIGRHGPFDGLFICGLLYHLDKPRKFIEEAARVCKKFMIIDTHVAPAIHEEAVDIYRLTGTEINEGLRGRWYPEYESVSAERLDQMKWSSWSNNKSFWIEKAYLLQVMKEAGFDMVFEQFDCETDVAAQYTAGFRARHARVFLVGVKPDAWEQKPKPRARRDR